MKITTFSTVEAATVDPVVRGYMEVLTAEPARVGGEVHLIFAQDGSNFASVKMTPEEAHILGKRLVAFFAKG